MRTRWVSPIPDRRQNSGRRESWWFDTEQDAIADAIQTATKKAAPPVGPERDWLWRQLRGQGWSTTQEDRA